MKKIPSRIGTRFSIILLALILCFQTKATDVERHEINGWPVYLINTKTGNKSIVAYHAQYGSDHDEPVKMGGRAHLWEHMMFQGNEIQTDTGAFFEVSDKIGAYDANAWTSGDSTFYFLGVHPDVIDPAAETLGGMLTRPIFDASRLDTERENVVTEINDYRGRDVWAANNGAWTHFLPETHPMSKFAIGTEAQVRSQTVDDLKALYYSNYLPSTVSIIVAANFDRLPGQSGAITKEKALEVIKKHFYPLRDDKDAQQFRNAEPVARDQELPPLEKKPSENFETLKYKASPNDNRYLIVKIPISSDVSHYAMESMLDSLNVDFEGSLKVKGKKEGLFSGFRIGDSTLNNLRYIDITAVLGPNGTPENVLELLYTYLGYLSQHGFNDELMALFKKRNVGTYTEYVKDAPTAARYLAADLSRTRSHERVFDYENTYGKISNDEIKQAAAAIIANPEGIFVTSTDPDLESDLEDPIFKRAYVIEEANDLVGKLKTASQQKFKAGQISLEIEEVPLSFSTKKELNLEELRNFDPKAPELTGRWDPKAKDLEGTPAVHFNNSVEDRSFSTLAVTSVLFRNFAVEDGAIKVQFRHPITLSAHDYAHLEIQLAAFHQRISAKLVYLDSMGIEIGCGTTNGKVTFSASASNAGAARSALDHIISLWGKSLKDPEFFSQQELELAKQVVVSGFNAQQNRQFPPMSVWDKASNSFQSPHVLGDEVIVAAIKEVSVEDLESFNETLKATVAQADTRISLIGPYTDKADASHFRDLAYELFPKGLSEQQRALAFKSPTSITQSALVDVELPESKKIGDVGIVRIYEGPKPGTTDEIWVSLFGKWLSNKFFNKLRDEYGIGYVHNAGLLRSSPDASFLRFMGMTGNQDDLKSSAVPAQLAKLKEKVEERVKKVLEATQANGLSVDEDALREQLLASVGGFERAAIIPILWDEILSEIRGTPLSEFQNILDGARIADTIEETDLSVVMSSVVSPFLAGGDPFTVFRRAQRSKYLFNDTAPDQIKHAGMGVVEKQPAITLLGSRDPKALRAAMENEISGFCQGLLLGNADQLTESVLK